MSSSSRSHEHGHRRGLRRHRDSREEDLGDGRRVTRRIQEVAHRSPPARPINPVLEKMRDPGFRSRILEALKERNLLKPEEDAAEPGQIPQTESVPQTEIRSPSPSPQKSEEEIEILECYDPGLRSPSPEPDKKSLPSGLREARGLDDYEFVTNISQGTYGVVYMGKCKKTGEYKAFKRVKKIQKDGRPEAFPLTSLREINILSSLRHPNIIGLDEICLSGGRGILKVMDYAEFDLKRVLEMKKDSFAASEIKCIAKQILQALSFLHDHWIMHRDLKPSNILYDSKGTIKLCDFGLARHYGEPLEKYTPLVVTLFYRAPELLLGTEKYSPAIDMWSFGCIFAETLLGEPLFKETSELAMLSKILETVGEPTEESWPEFFDLPNAKSIKLTGQTENKLSSIFSSGYAVSGPELLAKEGVRFLCGLLELNPDKRLTAAEALDHEYFREFPPPCHKRLLPTFVDPKRETNEK